MSAPCKPCSSPGSAPECRRQAMTGASTPPSRPGRRPRRRAPSRRCQPRPSIVRYVRCMNKPVLRSTYLPQPEKEEWRRECYKKQLNLVRSLGECSNYLYGSPMLSSPRISSASCVFLHSSLPANLSPSIEERTPPTAGLGSLRLRRSK